MERISDSTSTVWPYRLPWRALRGE